MNRIIRNFAIAACMGLAVQSQAAIIDLTELTNDTAVSIPDPGTATSTINVANHGSILDLDIILNSLTHTWDSDLIISLAHAGTSITLFDGTAKGASEEENFIGTIFDDEAPFYSIQNGNTYAPYTGVFKPAELLSAFDGMDIYGDWILSVTDTAEADSGSLDSWSIKISSVPESSSLALAIIGLLGLMVRRKLAV